MATVLRRDGPSDRRRLSRVEPGGDAIVRAQRWMSRARILDVSLGGIRLRTESTADSLTRLGDTVGLELRIDAPSSCQLALRGWIRRSCPPVHMLAIEFDAAASALADIVEAETPRRLDAERATVMVVDPRDERRAALCGELRRTRVRVVEARTPLEAIFRLEEPRSRVMAIAIADTVPIELAEALRAFVAGGYPWIRIAQPSVDQIVSAVVDA